MKKETLIIHTNAWPILKGLEPEQLGKLFAALILHQRDEDTPKMDDVTRMAFEFMAAQADRENEKYEETVARRKAAGKAGAAARWQTHKSHAINSHNDNDNVNDNVNVNDNERQESLAALPPLSQEEGDKIFQEYPGDGARLIDEVRTYYKGHADRPFPGWTEAVRTFAHNQRRWGKSETRGSARSIKDILDSVIPEG